MMRHDLRQEPYAVMPHVRICAGGAGQPAFLPQPADRLVDSKFAQPIGRPIQVIT